MTPSREVPGKFPNPCGATPPSPWNRGLRNASEAGRSPLGPRFPAQLRRRALAAAAWAACLLLPGHGAAAACGPAPADWIATADPLYVRAAPADCATTLQSPPAFAWPPYPGAVQYEFVLQFADGHSESAYSDSNWIAWPAVLPAADYAWRVRAVTAGAAAPFSQPRGFSVSPQALPFVMPAPSALSARALVTARPRSLPVGHENLVWRSNLMTMRYAGVQALRARVGNNRGLPVQDPAALPATPAGPPTVLQVQMAAEAETAHMLDAALAWVLAQQSADLDEARRRCLAIAAWDSGGPTSYANNDTVAMEIAWLLSLSYDWLYPNLSASERQAIIAAIAARAAPAHLALSGPAGSFAKTPYDSHGGHVVAQVAAIGAIMAGDIADAATWVEAAAPVYAHYLSPWGGEDGGYANGTSYALADLDSMLFMWDVLRRATLLDVSDKPWAANFHRMFAYFMPPGAPAGLFGDGAELRRDEEWGRVSKAYGARVPGALMRWYAGQVTGGEPSLPLALLSPPPPAAGALPGGTPATALIAATGWTAMHAGLANPPAFSVYFKSSPYGSYNHGHADQNAFVIHAGGEAFAIASGVYDWYASPHWLNWYAQTRAHNAITYDGGQGQMLGPRGDGLLSASGRITAFSAGAQADYVVGDARAAYAGGVTRAVRALVYVRPHTVVVFDDLAADITHLWEWNLHAPSEFLEPAPGVRAIAGGAATLCFRAFGPEGSAFSTGSGFPTPPAQPPASPQWHAVLQSPAATAARFVSVFDTDCAALAGLAAPALDGQTLAVDLPGWRVSFDSAAGQVSVEPLMP